MPVPFGDSPEWLLNHSEFQSWTKVTGRQALWLHGPSGIGKTVLMRSVVAFLEDRRRCATDPIIRLPVFFFFDDKDATRNTPGTFARSVLYQLLVDKQTGPLLQQFLEKNVPEGVNSDSELWRILSTLVSRSHGIMFQFVVDAVDEGLRQISNDVTILERLQELLALDWSGRVRLLISSRTTVPPGFRDIASIDMSNAATKSNVKTFIQAKVQQAVRASRISPQAAPEVEEWISNRSDGNFLLARLIWEQVSKDNSGNQSTWSRERIRARLSEIDTVSPEFVSIYCTLLQGIPASHFNRVRISLAILRVVRAKLTAEQLAFLVTLWHYEMDLQEKSIPNLKVLKAEAESFEKYLLETCGYMVKQDIHQTVDFAHVSARDLFAADRPQESSGESMKILSRFTTPDSNAHAILHMLCLSALYLEDRSTSRWVGDYNHVTKAIERAGTKFGRGSAAHRRAQLAATTSIGRTPVWVYAFRFCFDHYEAASAWSEMDRMLTVFLATTLSYWCHKFWWLDSKGKRVTGNYEIEPESVAESPPLAREYGLFQTLIRVDCHRIVKAMLMEGIKINYIPNKTARNELTLLSWAILCQRLESFKALLRNEEVAANYSNPPNAMKPIHYAAQVEDPFYIQTLIDRRPEVDINARFQYTFNGEFSDTSFAGTPLHLAISAGNIRVAEFLLGQPGIDIWAKDGVGRSAYECFFFSQIWGPVLGKIFKSGQVSSSRESSGLIASSSRRFFMADAQQWTEVQEEILRLEPLAVLLPGDVHDLNALAYYAYYGRKEKLLWTLERLPKHQFAIRQEWDRYDLLHLCANQGWEDIVYLLQRRYGVRSLASDHFGRTLLHWAIEHCWDTSRIVWSEYTSLLDVQDRDGQTAMHLAVANRNINAVELLAQSGANCFLRDKRGITPAHSAAELGFRDALHYFLDMDRREYGRTRSGASLLHLIAMWFDGFLVRRLIETKRALVNVRDKQGRTPLHYASMAGNLSSARQLLRLGAKVDIRDGNGMSPLHETIRSGAVDTAKLLIEQGANIHISDRFGQNCLHLCLRYGSDALLSHFLDGGVDVNQIDSFGMYPLHRACGGSRAVANVKYLVGGGADWNIACTSARRSPLITAVEEGRSDAIEAVISSIKKSRIFSSSRRQHMLDQALQVATELQKTAIEQILLTAGAFVDRRKIKVRRWYLPGAEPEHNRLPLVLRQREVEVVERRRRRSPSPIRTVRYRYATVPRGRYSDYYYD